MPLKLFSWSSMKIVSQILTEISQKALETFRKEKGNISKAYRISLSHFCLLFLSPREFLSMSQPFCSCMFAKFYDSFEHFYDDGSGRHIYKMSPASYDEFTFVTFISNGKKSNLFSTPTTCQLTPDLYCFKKKILLNFILPKNRLKLSESFSICSVNIFLRSC